MVTEIFCWVCMVVGWYSLEVQTTFKTTFGWFGLLAVLPAGWIAGGLFSAIVFPRLFRRAIDKEKRE